MKAFYLASHVDSPLRNIKKVKDPRGICQSTQSVQPAAPGCWTVTGDISLTHTPPDERSAEDLCISERLLSKREETQQVDDGWWLIRAWRALFHSSPCDLRWMVSTDSSVSVAWSGHVCPVRFTERFQHICSNIRCLSTYVPFTFSL